PDEPAVFREDVLNRLLEEELESAGTQAQRLASSPPRSPILTHSLTPLRRTNRNLSSEHSIHLKPSTISRRNQSLSEADSPPSPAGDDSSSPQPSEELEAPLLNGAAETQEKKKSHSEGKLCHQEGDVSRTLNASLGCVYFTR
ncbi:hypothetical protein ATANTOWER_023034, partial [Ataeniobius toweri]|nr:hypothetical protein [Ataeniobius toweri]